MCIGLHKKVHNPPQSTRLIDKKAVELTGKHNIWMQYDAMFYDSLHPASAAGVIVLALCVCVCVCLCVCPSHYPGRTKEHTDLNFGMEIKWKNI